MQIITKKISTLLLLLIFVLAAIFVFVRYFPKKTMEISLQQENSMEKPTSIENAPAGSTAKNRLYVSGWLPYWSKMEGAASLDGKWNLFNEINVFAYSVDADGKLADKSQINKEPWISLRKNAENQSVKIVPTILWGDANAMHKIFSDQALTQKHVAAISDMLEQNNFAGVDIDYEGKDIADKDNFSNFLKVLHAKLSSRSKTLVCTVEARAQDAPPSGFTGVRAMSWANDYSALNQQCDSVRIMAYDQVFQVYRAKTFSNDSQMPFAPNADINWVRDVMKYSLQYIDAGKLNLGIPTYGWEFLINKTASGYSYSQLKSISYPDAIAEAKAAGAAPKRNSGGELDFTFRAANSNGEHLVNFSDGEAIKQKIELATELNLQGVSFFKIDGKTDPEFFSLLKDLRN